MQFIMLHKSLQNFLPDKKLVRPIEFLIKMTLVYAAWRMFKFFAENYENFLWGGWEWVKNADGNAIAWGTAQLLMAFGYNLTFYHRLITVDGSAGIYVGDLCLGIAPMVIFTGFILAYGNNTKNKYWFIPFGLLLIFIINVVRMTALVLVQVNYSHAMFKLAHDWVYVVITYGLIFALVIWWMEKLSDKKSV